MICQAPSQCTSLLKCTQTGAFSPEELFSIFFTRVQTPIMPLAFVRKNSKQILMCVHPWRGGIEISVFQRREGLMEVFNKCQLISFHVFSPVHIQHENNDLKLVFFPLCKDFLRNIPGSVFSSDLYDRWICVMDQGNDEEKINTIQR